MKSVDGHGLGDTGRFSDDHGFLAHMLQGEPRLSKLGGGAAVEVRVLKAHIRRDFILRENYVDPVKWQPLIYSFRHYFGLGAELGKTFRAEI